MNKNPLNLNIDQTVIHFETHDFDWDHPGIGYLSKTDRTIIHIDYRCKNCEDILFDEESDQTVYFMDDTNRTCNETVMEKILK